MHLFVYTASSFFGIHLIGKLPFHGAHHVIKLVPNQKLLD